MEWSRTCPYNPLPQLNSHGLQAVDKNKQAAPVASAPDLLILSVIHLRGLKSPGGSELVFDFPGLKAGAVEEDKTYNYHSTGIQNPHLFVNFLY